MRRPSKLLVGFVGLIAVLATGLLTATPAQARFFHHWGYGYGEGGPWFQPRPWFYPRAYYIPPPPPVYVPRVAYVVPPVVYGYRYHVVHHYYRHVVHTAVVHHHWCSCDCCR